LSKINPYAPKKKVVAEETVAPVETAVIDVPTGSVSNILKWVGQDADKAKAAYDVEKEDTKPRVSLLTALKELF